MAINAARARGSLAIRDPDALPYARSHSSAAYLSGMHPAGAAAPQEFL